MIVMRTLVDAAAESSRPGTPGYLKGCCLYFLSVNAKQYGVGPSPTPYSYGKGDVTYFAINS